MQDYSTTCAKYVGSCIRDASDTKVWAGNAQLSHEAQSFLNLSDLVEVALGRDALVCKLRGQTYKAICEGSWGVASRVISALTILPIGVSLLTTPFLTLHGTP